MRKLLRRFKRWWKRNESLADLEEEMRLHRELRTEMLSAKGMPAEEAEFAARRWFGNTTLLKEDSHNMLTWNVVEDFLNDVRHSLRSLAANLLFACVVILTLALGIGANSAIFSVMNAVLLRGLPVSHPEQLAYLRVVPGQPDGAGNTGNGDSSFSESVYERLREQRSVFSAVIAYVPLGSNKIAVRIGDIPEEAAVEMVSGDLFSGLGVGTECGRTFGASDEKNHSTVAVLGYGYWSRLGSSCSVVGRTLYVKGVALTIIGVAARDFAGTEPTPTDVWIPLQKNPALNAWGSPGKSFYDQTDWWCLPVIVRVRPGMSFAQVEARLAGPFQRAAYEYLGGHPKQGEKAPKLQLAPARGLGESAENYRQPLYLLLSIVGVILVIACGNVAMLQAARNATRRREFSIRLAMGGSQGRLFRQLFAESLLLCTLGAGLGWLMAVLFTRALARWADLEISFAPDFSVALFTCGVMVATALLFGLFPLAAVRRVPVGIALKDSAATAYQGKSKSRSARLIVIAQVAMGLVLAVCAGLLTRTLRNLEHADLGLKSDGLLVFGLSARTEQATLPFYNSVIEGLRRLPGVVGVTTMENRIGSGWSNNTNAFVDGKTPDTMMSRMRWNKVGADFFTTIGTPVLEGRDFRQSDLGDGQKVAIVNQTFAKNFFKNREALGHLVSYGPKVGYTVVGVVADSKYTGVKETPIPMAYFPFAPGGPLGDIHVEMRTAGDPMAFLPAVRKAVASFSSDLAPLQPMTQRAQFDVSIGQERLVSRLSVFFSALAVLLVASGLYGTLAYNVSRRTSEFGVRMAIGCERSRLLWLVLREGMALSLIGVAIGLPLAIAAARWFSSMLFGLSALDAATFVLAVLGIVTVCLVAGMVPALRAASINPMRALRYE